ncbi:MAG: hypothetical protein ACPG8A_01320 [Psychrobium sp.]
MKLKKFTVGLLIGFISLSHVAIAGEFDRAGLSFRVTDNLKDVYIDGSNIQYLLSNRKIFAVSFVHTDTKNAYPLLEAFAEQLRERMFPSDSYTFKPFRLNSQKLTTNGVQSISYLMTGSKAQCELFIASAIGKRSYLFTTITNEIDKTDCDSGKDELEKSIKEISQGMVFTK